MVFQSDALPIGDAIFGKVSHGEAVILIGAVHNPLEHVSIDLFLACIRDSPRDGVLEFH